MSSVSMGSVFCGQCGQTLNEEVGLPHDLRAPCPKCASKARQYSVEAQSSVRALSALRATGFRAKLSRTKGWFIKIFVGEVPQHSRDNAIADVERASDRDNDQYVEKVIMQSSGEIIHQTDERLSEHKGHGSDKKRK